MSLVDMEDFAEAAAVILSNKDYANGTFELCGKGSYSLQNMEAVFPRWQAEKSNLHI